MIDVNDLNKLDCKQARVDLDDFCDISSEANAQAVYDFIDQVEALQRKYTKPIATLLKRDANG